ncbi:TPA: diaminopimelate decarboxylase [Candidatus Gracilibacteria bacterium]|nr:diaminopimelate decarboxylase [Candidatus Gracilibacteria bacterium]HIQ57470.1 diaminopimelate decarboxylase [Candidatus Gracilibacteria bacterium]
MNNKLSESNKYIKKMLELEEIQTPAYFYNEESIRKQINILNTNTPDNFEIFYAMKGNSNPFIIEFFKNNGFGTEIASGGELFLAKKVGFKGDQIIYTGPSKSNEELKEAVKFKLKTIHIESVNEAIRLNKICEELGVVQNILVRVNANFEVHTTSTQLSGCASPFGITEEVLLEELPKIFELSNIHFQGLHVYNASGILDYKLLLQNVQNVFEMVNRIESEFPDEKCEYIDFGGGLGIDYEHHSENSKNCDIPAFYNGLKEKVKNFNFEDRKLIMEISRFLVAESGTYVTQIRDIKHSRGTDFYICDGGVNHFATTMHFDRPHPISVIHKNLSITINNKYPINITGPLCTGVDVLGKNAPISQSEVGDFICVEKTGCYALNAGLNHFLSHRMPIEILFNKNNWKVVRKRGEREDLLLNIDY